MNEQEIHVAQVDGTLADLVTRAEYDVQIATARRYPRSIKNFINSATELVTLNEQVADDCIYALPRAGKTIEGPSARFAEIILHCWGHTRAGARVVNEDGKFVTAQGVCHDLQNNTLIAFEVRRRITDSKGKRYNDDMIGVTGNAASSIALRNAITKVIPKALWEPLYQEARKVVVGDSKTLANKRAAALDLLQKFGATNDMVLKKLEVKGIEEITLDHLVALRGIVTAIKEGDTTVEQVFFEQKENTVLNNLNEAIKNGDAKTPAASEKENPALQTFLDDFASVPTLEGLKFKFDKATEILKDATPEIHNKLVQARDKREAELKAPITPEAKGKTMFSKKDTTA